MSKRTFIIVGASLAGAKAAEELRGRGFEGRVVLIGSEPERPYERPPLTKDYLRGESEREKAYVHERGFYEQHQIELLAETTATAIDPGASRVTLADGRELGYDRLLLTTGAEPRRLPVPGAELDGVYYLRTLADCDALRERLESAATSSSSVLAGSGVNSPPPRASAASRSRSSIRSRCRTSGSSAPRSARSTATCIATTASSWCSARASRSSRATAP